MSKLVSSCLYFTSFLPLWISILFIDIKSRFESPENLWTERISICVISLASIISFIVLQSAFAHNSKEGSTKLMVKDVADDKTISSEYLLSYILPLFAFDFTKWDQVVLFLIFFVMLGFLCISHNHFSANICLEILNYKMFTCELEDEDKNVIQWKIISHRTLTTHKGEYIYLKSLNNEIKLDINEKKQ
ncbi:hypothetical protein C815_00552 [Firmicutes bacterium M10-2]|nr:hypothetical protein C815_00552 [Firmicutes bacterium M10-2]